MRDPWLSVLLALLGSRIEKGELTLTLPRGAEHHLGGRAPGPSAQVDLHDPAVARRMLLGGSIALAEGYMDRSWDTPNLDAVLDLGIANLPTGGAARLPVALRPLHLWRHGRCDNDLAGARCNIEYHYDLGNDFYRQWLDPTMTYSAACFDGGHGAQGDRAVPGHGRAAGDTVAPVAAAGAPAPGGPDAERDLRDPLDELEQAQRRKWDRVLELIQPRSGDRLLEIGCGWGGFAMHAAEQADCRVVGLTLSAEQAALARRQVEERGLSSHVEIREQDYRQEAGTYQGIASIEMFEAVGMRWWPVFFGKIRKLLRPGGRAGLQVITIADEHFERYRRRPDFIQRYIFPGGMLPSPARFTDTAAAAGLQVGRQRFFGEDYARTLGIWATRFEEALPEVRRQGFDERFIRMWRYYLAYCRAGFAGGRINVMQVGLAS